MTGAFGFRQRDSIRWRQEIIGFCGTAIPRLRHSSTPVKRMREYLAEQIESWREGAGGTEVWGVTEENPRSIVRCAGFPLLLLDQKASVPSVSLREIGLACGAPCSGAGRPACPVQATLAERSFSDFWSLVRALERMR